LGKDREDRVAGGALCVGRRSDAQPVSETEGNVFVGRNRREFRKGLADEPGVKRGQGTQFESGSQIFPLKIACFSLNNKIFFFIIPGD